MHATATEFLLRLKKFTLDNSPAILSGVAVAGTLSTAILSAKASYQAVKVIQEEQKLIDLTQPDPITLEARDKAKLVWKLYIPAAAAGTITIVCIVGANTISSRRGAALATAVSLTETAFKEYKEKVVEQIGSNKEQKLRDELMQDRVQRNPAATREVIITGNGDVLCYESLTSRYFQSNMEALRKAENDINAQIIHEMYASLNDFFRHIGLGPAGFGEEVGWNTQKLLELQFSTVLSEDGRPCLAIGYAYTPIRDYYRFP